MVNVIEVQGTPNPDALKFVTDARLIERGARSLESPSDALSDPLGQALFAAGPVASVFILDRFVTVTKFPNADWAGLEPQLRAAIEKYATAVTAPEPSPTAAASGSDEIRTQIEQVINENIRPALAGDGGGLDILDFQDNVLTVHYQGACGSCPSASAGTLYAIQDLLQRRVDPRIRVELV